MLDYDREAEIYDETRGGAARAEAAAEAVAALLPAGTGTVVDVGGGTGIVSACLTAGGRRVVVTDRSRGMLGKAQERLPGRVVRADGTALPFRSASVDAVTAICLLHLVPDAEPFVAEAARVLRPGGVLVTTVDKHRTGRADAPDARPRLEALARTYGLEARGEQTFVAYGQRGEPVYTLCAFARRRSATSALRGY